MASAPRIPPGFTIQNSRTSPELFKDPAVRKTIYEFLKSPEVYWGHGRSQAVIDRQIAKAYINFGVFTTSTGTSGDGHEEANSNPPSLVGYSRVIGDGERFAYMTDVFILPAYRGQGLGKQLAIYTIQNSGDPELDDPDSRDSTKWWWFLYATEAKDMYIRMGFHKETDAGYELSPGMLVVNQDVPA